MGMAKKKRGHADLAEKAYRQALEIDPNMKPARIPLLNR
jgi:Flp pilus assembly protein TadD